MDVDADADTTAVVDGADTEEQIRAVNDRFEQALKGAGLKQVRTERRSYRFEQGFTYELTVAGVADEARHAFAEGRDAEFDA